eukprot:scaffold11298_cov50-Attheya_sp.AAC.2
MVAASAKNRRFLKRPIQSGLKKEPHKPMQAADFVHAVGTCLPYQRVDAYVPELQDINDIIKCTCGGTAASAVMHMTAAVDRSNYLTAVSVYDKMGMSEKAKEFLEMYEATMATHDMERSSSEEDPSATEEYIWMMKSHTIQMLTTLRRF